MQSEQTTDRTFRVTVARDGRVGVTVFAEDKAIVVFWLESEDVGAAQRLAHHLETQVDRIAALARPAAPADPQARDAAEQGVRSNASAPTGRRVA